MTDWCAFVKQMPIEAVNRILAETDSRKDGPMQLEGARTPCAHCGVEKESDMYYVAARPTCGDCRFWLRRGVHATYDRHGLNGRKATRRGRQAIGPQLGSQTLGRFKHLYINSKREIPILDSWIEDCSASIK